MGKEEITKAEIDRLAGLSGLEFTSAEKDVLVREVKDVIDMLNGCSKIVTVDNMSNVSCGLNGLREDSVTSTMSSEDALSNAPKSKDGYFVVPKVVE